MIVISCKTKRAKRHRTTLSITIDPHVLDALKRWMRERAETNISAVIESFIDCGVRDNCEGCPYYEEMLLEERKRIQGKVGIGKLIAE